MTFAEDVRNAHTRTLELEQFSQNFWFTGVCANSSTSFPFTDSIHNRLFIHARSITHACSTQQRRNVFFSHHSTLSNYALPTRRVQGEAVNRTTDRHKIPTCTLQTRMSTSPCLDVHFTARAVIEWQSDHESDRTTRILAKPDPKVSSITLTARFDSKGSLFDIHIPLKLKGLDNTSDVTLRACASSVISLDVVKNPTVSSEVEQEFKSPALGLRFQLNRHLDILVPTPALEPICPAGRARSGVVLDAIREFSRATAFTVYIEARNASPKLQSVSDAVSQGFFKTSSSSRFQLASMYAGLGAKIVQLGADEMLAPPSYEETEPPPPPPPIDHKPDRKRPRQDTETERAEEIALIWAELQMLKQAKATDWQRIAFLEKENQELRETVAKLQEQYKAFDRSQQDIHHSFGALETAVEKNTQEFEESVGNELAELRLALSLNPSATTSHSRVALRALQKKCLLQASAVSVIEVGLGPHQASRTKKLWPVDCGRTLSLGRLTTQPPSRQQANHHLVLMSDSPGLRPPVTGDDQQGQRSTDTNVSNAPELTFELVLSAIPNSVIDVSYGHGSGGQDGQDVSTPCTASSSFCYLIPSRSRLRYRSYTRRI
ncbi:hypothetical protein FOXYSP1_16332 [Fusarium oxysporum f. sp. phaseoli]